MFFVYLSMSNEQNQILSVQYLRGLAALGVVLCHYGFFNAGQLGVDVFFMISGFIIVFSLDKSDYNPRYFLNFLLKRSIRIDPSYLAVIGLTFVLFWVLSLIPHYKGHAIAFVPGQFIANVFYYVPVTKFGFYNSVFWTLSVEFQFYIIIGLLYFSSAKQFYKAVFTICFSLTCLILPSKPYSFIFHYAPIFALGIALNAFYHKRNLIKALLPLALLVFIAYQFSITIFVLLGVSSLILLFFQSIVKQLSFLGDISYSLYLTHSLTLIVMLGIFKRLQINTEQHHGFWLITEVSIALSVAYLFYVLIEKPTTKLSKRIKIKG